MLKVRSSRQAEIECPAHFFFFFFFLPAPAAKPFVLDLAVSAFLSAFADKFMTYQT